ncbi:MAG TPA: VWA domain-containing protein [Pseudonocardia sp.]|nr:VWA domain-containing protein [Pseudonocardia sp.]
MARHRARHRAPRRRGGLRRALVVPLAAGLAVVVAAGVLTGLSAAGVVSLPGPGAPVAAAVLPPPPCPDSLRVVTAASFAPALAALGPALAPGPDCLRLEVEIADGRAAAARVAEVAADVWIPDDGAWAGLPGPTRPATAAAVHARATVAVSPLYLVAEPDTAARVAEAGGTWRALARLVDADAVTLTMREPAGSGDGLLAAGALGEGAHASAGALVDALPAVRTVAAPAPALPEGPGEVGVVPEYALLAALRSGTAGVEVLAPTDHTAALRYTWVPTAEAADHRAPLLDRLWDALNGPDATAALATAGLRRPGIGLAPGARPGELPPAAAPLFDVLDRRRVEHVFATWYPSDRRADVLAVVDVSGSMGVLAPGSDRPLIELARDGVRGLAALLPDDARLGLWEFGTRLTPTADHRVLLDPAALGAEHRTATEAALARLVPRRTGSGLHDTVLAAHLAARDDTRPGVPGHVLVLTDGHDEDDPGSPTVEQLAERLVAQRDPQRPVEVSVVTVGDRAEAGRLAAALTPAGVRVHHVSSADEVRAVFLRAAAGGPDG